MIERIKFELHGSSKKNVNQIVKEFQHVIQRQLDILNNYKIYLSDESHRIAKKVSDLLANLGSLSKKAILHCSTTIKSS